jgi:hypothetical protein
MKNMVIGVALAAACGLTAAAGMVSTSEGQAGVDSWPGKWCEAQPGNTKEQVVALMGPPTDTSPTTMTWAARQYRFYAFLDAAGRVKQLDINTYSLSPADKASLKCETVRTTATVARAAKKAAAKPQRTYPTGCALVTAAEMSDILGAKVVAEPRGGSTTECTYKAVAGISPAVKLSVDWGDGRIAMSSAGIMGRREPGLTNPYDGIGDQAAAVGPALMIRTGEDLMTIVFTGVADAPAKARRIFATAKARM